MIEYASKVRFPNPQYDDYRSVRFLWTNDTAKLHHGWYTVSGWYLVVSYSKNKMIGMIYWTGDIDVNADNSPFISPGGPGPVADTTFNWAIRDGIVVGGSLADQIMFDAMLKRLPAVRRIPYDKFVSREVEI